MSQSLSMILIVINGVVGYSVTMAATGSDIVSMAVAAVAGLTAPFIVWYSPRPDSTHHFGMGVKRQKWGFTSEQDGDKWIYEPVNRKEGDSE